MQLDYKSENDINAWKTCVNILKDKLSKFAPQLHTTVPDNLLTR